MLITFTTEHGDLVIRAEDLRRLQDVRNEAEPSQPPKCWIDWVQHDRIFTEVITGTAAENRDRIVQQEAQVITAYEEAQRRAAAATPRDLGLTRGGKIRTMR